MGTTQTTEVTSEWKRVLPAPGEDETTVTALVNSTTRAFRTSRYSVEGVTVEVSGATAYLDAGGQDYKVRFKNCNMNATTTLTSAPVVYRAGGTYFLNCTGNLGNRWKLGTFGGNFQAEQYDGCQFDHVSATRIDSWQRVVCCTGNSGYSEKSAANPAPTQDGTIIAHNAVSHYNTNSQNLVGMGGSTDISRGLALIGNIFEKTAGTSPAIQIAADGSTANVNHVLLWHNTVAGERGNLAYGPDDGTVGYERRNWSIQGNSFRDYNNSKQDLFVPENANRTGGWSIMYGVAVQHNHYEITTFEAEYDGFDVTKDTVAGYVDDQSFTGGGTGNGQHTRPIPARRCSIG